MTEEHEHPLNTGVRSGAPEGIVSPTPYMEPVMHNNNRNTDEHNNYIEH